jgi:hypothetical protein
MNGNKSMKGIAYIVIAIVAVAFVWWLISGNQGRTVAFEGVVTEVVLEPLMVNGPRRMVVQTLDGDTYHLAVPSMGRNLCKATEITAPDVMTVGDRVSVKGEQGEDGAIVPCMSNSHYLRVMGSIADFELGMGFLFRKGPNGYVLEKPPGMSASADFVKGYLLTLESDYLELANATGTAREGSPSLSMRAYRNPQKLDAAVWVLRHPLESNANLATGEPTEAVVGGANAVTYTIDGLYPTDVYVVANGSHIFIFTGAYLDENSVQKRDFEDLIESVTFLPAEGQQ